MNEDINYSTVTFQSGPPQEKNEVVTIYSVVKPEAPAAVPAPKGDTAAQPNSRLLLVCLGILCALLVVSIITIIYLSVIMTEQKANLSELMEGMRILENKTAKLSRDRNDLNHVLGVILNFSSFPVTEYCPDKKCQPCRSNWIRFQEKCYLIYEEEDPWKKWEESRKYCQSKTADLVVIDSLQEQEFITNHTKYYYDKFHGYWLGLYKKNGTWVWIDGREDTLSFWIGKTLGSSGMYALMIPGNNPTQSWDPAEGQFKNKFICESEALIRSE